MKLSEEGSFFCLTAALAFFSAVMKGYGEGIKVSKSTLWVDFNRISRSMDLAYDIYISGVFFTATYLLGFWAGPKGFSDDSITAGIVLLFVAIPAYLIFELHAPPGFSRGCFYMRVQSGTIPDWFT